MTNGLSPYGTSAYASGSNIPTGTPRSPLFGAQPITIPMPRLLEQPRHQLTPFVNPMTGETEAAWPCIERPVPSGKAIEALPPGDR